MTQKTAQKAGIKLPILLMIWPIVALMGSLLIYAVVSFVFGAYDPSGNQHIFVTITNVLLFLVGAAAIGLGIPSFIVGLVMLITRASQTSNNQSAKATAADKQATQKHSGISIAGMILGITGVLSSWFGVGLILGVIGIVFSAIGLKKPGKNGMAIAGLVTGIFAVVIGGFMLIAITIASYNSIKNRAQTDSFESIASRLAIDAEAYNITNHQYPDFKTIQASNSLSDTQRNSLGNYSSTNDVIYIGCYGNGAIIWYWDSANEKYNNDYSVGNTYDCNYDE